MAILEIKNVSKFFGGLAANSDVSFDVHEGTIMGLIGPNGAGKTTLFSLIAGSIPPTAGAVLLDGVSMLGRPAFKMVRAGVVRTHQIVKPFPNLSVVENVVVGALHAGGRATGSVRDRAVEVLAFVGLEDRTHAFPGTLTLAGRKRLELARALATAPRVLMLDEVIAGLNPAEAQALATLIRRIRDERQVSVIMIEHVMPAVMSLSDRVVVLDRGRKIAEGTPAEVVNDSVVVDAYLGENHEGGTA